MSSDLLLAVALAFAAASLFAVTTNLHRGAASAVPMSDGGPVRLLLRLLRTPRWLLGSAAALVALGLHTVALRFGTVIVVQAVLSTGLVLALALEALRERRRPALKEVGAWVLVVAGIITLLGLAHPHGGRSIGTVALALTLLLAVARRLPRPARRPHPAAAARRRRRHGRLRRSALRPGRRVPQGRSPMAAETSQPGARCSTSPAS